MCELLAKSSRQATTVNLSLSEFAQHGGRTGPHRDGWGIAYYEETDIRLIKDTKQASESPWEDSVPWATRIPNMPSAPCWNI